MVLGRTAFAAGEKPRRNNGINLEDITMRVAAGLILAGAISVAMTGAAWSQTAAKPTAAAQADPCNVKGNQPPDCQTVDVTLTLKKDQTKGWALYCPAEAYYYWGGWSDQWSSRWHIITENLLAENEHKADFTLTNTRLGDNTVTVTIGCSPIAPWGGGCTGPSRRVADPQCPQHNQRQVCSGEGEDEECWSERDETCVNGEAVTNYSCTQALFKTMCYTCQG